MASRRSFLAQIKAFISQLTLHYQEKEKQLDWSTKDQQTKMSQPTRDLSTDGKLENGMMPPPTAEHRPSIAILGAGIGGLALAIGLAKRNISCTVYDACEKFSTVGAGIGLGPNSLAAIDALDPTFRLRYDAAKTGNERADFEHSVFDALYAEPGFGAERGWTRGLVGAPYFTRSSAHRKDLLDIMETLVPPGTLQFSNRAEEVRQVGDKVRLRFEGGEEAEFDTVIACDGVKGISRRAVLGDVAPEQVPPAYAGMYIYRGILPMEEAKEILGEHGGDAKWFMAQGKGVAIYPISKGAEENFVFFVADADPDRWSPDAGTVPCTREEMVADLAGFDPRLLRLLDHAKPLRWPILHHPQTRTYYRGRICLLGDVAHASSPHQAAGAGQGLEDAVVLAHLLSLVRQPDQLETAFRVYDGIRRPRAQRVVQTSYEAGVMYNFMDPQLGDDMPRIVENANQRLHWIWQHDLKADVRSAEDEFLALTAGGSRGGYENAVDVTLRGAMPPDSMKELPAQVTV